MSRLDRINQLVGELNISKSSIYLWVSQGNFPAPFKIGGGTSVWHEEQISDWLESKRKEAK